MSLKTLQTIMQKITAFKCFHSDKSMCFRFGIQTMSFNRFHSNRNDKSNHYYQSTTCRIGIGVSVGCAMVWGILRYGQSLCDKFDGNYSFVSCAASRPPDDIKKSARDTFNFVADVVEKTRDSVVYIEIVGRHPFTGKPVPVSNGSGFIVKSDGLILTNAHVVNHKGLILVKLFNGHVYEAVVENIDRETDLATVRIKEVNLPVLPLGTSANVRPGEFVIVMGNPLTLSHTITAGVVSSTSRPGEEIGLHKKTDYIQTDAAINVGNSGGPLVNLNGEAIGISTMKVTEGISFAIPSDRAIEFLEKIEQKLPGQKSLLKRSDNEPKNKFLGLNMLTLSPTIVADIRLRAPEFPPIDHGVLVWRVMVGSASFEHGIKPGDVILKVNGEDAYHVSTVVEHVKNNDNIKLTIQRGEYIYDVCFPLTDTQNPL